MVLFAGLSLLRTARWNRRRRAGARRSRPAVKRGSVSNVPAAHALRLARHAVNTNAADVEPALVAALGSALHHHDNGLFPQTQADIELVRAVFAQGHGEEAQEPETALILAAQREVLGDDHSCTLATGHIRAEILAASGRTAEATAEPAQVLAQRTRT